jgi:hypothetical protein
VYSISYSVALQHDSKRQCTSLSTPVLIPYNTFLCTLVCYYLQQTTAPGTACASAAAPPLLTLSDNYGPAQNAVGSLWTYSGVRTGNTVSGTGVVSYAFGKYTIQPDSSSLVFNSGVNAAPAAAGRCTGTGCVRVASANVLNLFTTLDISDPALGTNTPRKL